MNSKIVFTGYLGTNKLYLDYLTKLNKLFLANGLSMYLISYSSFVYNINVDSNTFIPEDDTKYDHSLKEYALVESKIRSIDYNKALNRITQYKEFMLKLIKKVKPKLFIISVQFTGYHLFLKKLCDENNISYMFQCGGMLPGTINVEPFGMMVDSSFCDYRSSSTYISNEEALMTSQYLSFAKDNRESLDRKTQPLNTSSKSFIKSNRKTLFFAGHNDYCCGVYPYNKKAKEASPFFKNSVECIKYLDKLAEKNNWEILFKPHPNILNQYDDIENKLSGRVKIFKNANIYELMDKSDVCISMLSQSAYLFLISDKPTVLLARSPLTQKGCCYEPESKESIESEIQLALKSGYTKKMHSNFIIHSSILLKNTQFIYHDSLREILTNDIHSLTLHIKKHLTS